MLDPVEFIQNDLPGVTIQQFKEMGYLPQAMVNYLALLGWGDGTENEFYTLQQLGRFNIYGILFLNAYLL